MRCVKFHLANLAFALAAALAALMPFAATAQELPCAPREQVLSAVIDRIGAERLALGRAAEGATIELYATQGGNWTLLLNLPDGRSCLLGAGDGFEATQGLQPPRGAPA